MLYYRQKENGYKQEIDDDSKTIMVDAICYFNYCNSYWSRIFCIPIFDTTLFNFVFVHLFFKDICHNLTQLFSFFFSLLMMKCILGQTSHLLKMKLCHYINR